MSASPAYQGLHVYYGDLHNHCNISYGHGDLEDAYANARLQLDFASVTGHAHWPDMPPAEGRLKYLVDYHRHGFERLASIWDRVQETTEKHHEEHRFVSFLSFEWHSMRHGDYRVIARRSASEVARREAPGFRGKVTLAVGWGEAARPTDWRVSFGIRDGRLLAVEPRFSGEESVSPQARDLASYQVSSWSRAGEDEVSFTTRTSPNPNTRTDRAQKLTLEIEGDDHTRVVADINGRELAHTLSELRQGPRTGYLDGFVSEAFQLSRAVPEAEYRWSWRMDDRGEADERDFYYVRVRQKNDQWAWSSPVWI